MALDKDLVAAAAMADTSKLTPFEGCEVVRSVIAITKAGDGLSAAMAVAPTAYHHGDEVFVLLKCNVVDVQHPPVSKDTPNVLTRKHKFEAQSAAVVDAKWAREAIDKQEKTIAVAKDKARGQERMVGADGDDTEANPAAMSFQSGKAKKTTKAAAKLAENNLRQLSKDNLRELCTRHDLPFTTRTTGAQFLDLLVGVDGIADEAAALHGLVSPAE